MKKIKNFLTDANELVKLLNQFHLSALEINREYFKRDYDERKRSGQCASALQYEGIRICAQYIPDKDTENKIRYITSGNTKIDYLLEHPGRIDTFPVDVREETLFRNIGLWGGGVRIKVYGIPLISTSGFAPKVDEACSICTGSEFYFYELSDEQEKIDFIISQMKEFSNPYPLAISAHSRLVKSVSFEDALKIGTAQVL